MAKFGGKRNNSCVYAICVMDKMNDAKLRAFYDEDVKLLCIRRQVLLKNTSRLLADMYSHMHARDVANRTVEERAPACDVIDVLPDERVGEFDEDVAMEDCSVKSKGKSEDVSQNDVTNKRCVSKTKRARQIFDVLEGEFHDSKAIKRRKLTSNVDQKAKLRVRHRVNDDRDHD